MMTNRPARQAAILMLMYIAAGFSSIALGSLNGGNLAAIWLAAGIGLIIMLQTGKLAPYLVMSASFIVNAPLIISHTAAGLQLALLASVASAGVDALQSALAAKHFRQLKALHPDSVWPTPTLLPMYLIKVALIPIALTVPMLIGIQYGAGLMHHHNAVEIFRSLISLLLSDLAGIMLIVPLYQSWQSNRLWSTFKQIWIPLLILVALLIGALLFYRYLMALVLPVLLYLAIRYQQTGVSIALLMLTELCMVGTALGYGLFADPSTLWAFLNVQLFIFALMLTMQYLASMQAALKHQHKEMRKALNQRSEELIFANERLLELATTDDLTQVPNRREWQRRCAEAIVRTRRYHQPMSIIMLDIDYFKKVNDQYGHLAGDLVLKRISQLCVQRLRSIDTFARWGGEEFVVLLPETDQVHAALVAEKLRKTVEAQHIMIDNHTEIIVTISLGVTSLSMIDLTLDDLLSRADEALYAAKAAGRNCVIEYSNLSTHYLSDPSDPAPQDTPLPTPKTTDW
ncbi:diguanylate cyclase [Chitinibacter sp. S2-10]|uniref:GGDEF domain-containing protein n=1 Tax=Chitinibacter sp. S2-10 TaxID=3373597 RepID=UPI0039778350